MALRKKAGGIVRNSSSRLATGAVQLTAVMGFKKIASGISQAAGKASNLATQVSLVDKAGNKQQQQQQHENQNRQHKEALATPTPQVRLLLNVSSVVYIIPSLFYIHISCCAAALRSCHISYYCTMIELLIVHAPFAGQRSRCGCSRWCSSGRFSCRKGPRGKEHRVQGQVREGEQASGPCRGYSRGGRDGGELHVV